MAESVPGVCVAGGGSADGRAQVPREAALGLDPRQGRGASLRHLTCPLLRCLRSKLWCVLEMFEVLWNWIHVKGVVRSSEI